MELWKIPFIIFFSIGILCGLIRFGLAVADWRRYKADLRSKYFRKDE